MNQDENTRRIAIRYLKTHSVKIVVTPRGVELHLPEGYDESKAMETVNKHRLWIERRMQELSELAELSKKLELVDRSMEELKQLVKDLANQASLEILDISNPCKIVVRDMSRKWASLSSKGVLTINKLARYLPEQLLRYVVYHEMCHLLERRHNSRFWSCVEKHVPDYRRLEKLLKAIEVKLANSNESYSGTETT